MNKRWKFTAAFLISVCLYNVAAAQQPSISKKQFDELWNKADSSSKIVIKTGANSATNKSNNTSSTK